MQSIDECIELLAGAEFWVELGVIGDIVAMHASRPRLQNRRGIHMAHAQTREVRNDPARVLKRKLMIELKTIRRTREPTFIHGRRSSLPMVQYFRV